MHHITNRLSILDSLTTDSAIDSRSIRWAHRESKRAKRAQLRMCGRQLRRA
jgi:hypothetical protein